MEAHSKILRRLSVGDAIVVPISYVPRTLRIGLFLEKVITPRARPREYTYKFFVEGRTRWFSERWFRKQGVMKLNG